MRRTARINSEMVRFLLICTTRELLPLAGSFYYGLLLRAAGRSSIGILPTLPFAWGTAEVQYRNMLDR